MSSIAKVLRHEDIVDKLDEIPALPSIVYELSQVINDPMSSTSDVEKIMSNEQGLTTKVLKLVNSAYYSIPGGVSNLGRAIAYIGFDTVHQLVLSSSIINALETKGPSEFDMNQFWVHSVGVAIASETIAKQVGHPMPPDVFTCGLVHDMGKIALFIINQEIFLNIVKHAETNNCTFNQAESELEIPKHTLIGSLLAQKWRLPGQIETVIKYHHQKEIKTRGSLSADSNQNVDIVMLGNLLTHALKFGNSGHKKILGAPKEVLQRLTINPEEGFVELLRELKSCLEKAEDFIKLIGS